MAQLIITSTDTGGNKNQTVLTNINPEASNGTLKNFAEQFNALTNNTYVGTIKVDREDITTSASKNILEIENFVSFTMAEIKEAVTENGAFYTSAECEGVPTSWHGSGKYTMFFVKSPYPWLSATAYFNVDALTLAIKINGEAGEETTGEFVIYLPETDETAAVTINVPISDE